jgi:hypothetical protein
VNGFAGHAADSGITPSLSAAGPWLDLHRLADVTIVAAGKRVAGVPRTWSADCPGEQTIEIRFRHQTTVSRLRVVIGQADRSCTQRITIWASSRRGERHREILRRTFTSLPGGATAHVEECAVQLESVSALQVRIVPSIDGGRAIAHVNEVLVAG